MEEDLGAVSLFCQYQQFVNQDVAIEIDFSVKHGKSVMPPLANFSCSFVYVTLQAAYKFWFVQPFKRRAAMAGCRALRGVISGLTINCPYFLLARAPIGFLQSVGQWRKP